MSIFDESFAKTVDNTVNDIRNYEKISYNCWKIYNMGNREEAALLNCKHNYDNMKRKMKELKIFFTKFERSYIDERLEDLIYILSIKLSAMKHLKKRANAHIKKYEMKMAIAESLVESDEKNINNYLYIKRSKKAVEKALIIFEFRFNNLKKFFKIINRIN